MHERDALAVRLGMLEAKLDETRVERGQVAAGLRVAACMGSAHGVLLSAASLGAVHTVVRMWWHVKWQSPCFAGRVVPGAGGPERGEAGARRGRAADHRPPGEHSPPSL